MVELYLCGHNKHDLCPSVGWILSRNVGHVDGDYERGQKETAEGKREGRGEESPHWQQGAKSSS